MKGLLLITVTFGVLFVGSQAAYCKKETTSYFSSSYYTYIYCSNGCCGTTYSRYCCSSSSNLYDYTSSYWGAGTIAGAVIGSIIGICVFIAIIVVIIKVCTKSGGQGRVIRPIQNPANNQMFVVSTGVHATAQPYPPSQPGIAPPSYGVPGMSYPPPPPLYSSPEQPVGSGKMS